MPLWRGEKITLITPTGSGRRRRKTGGKTAWVQKLGGEVSNLATSKWE